MLANKLAPHSIEITNEMRTSIRAVRTRYAVYLEEEKKQNKSLKTECAKKSLTEKLRRFGVRLLRKKKPVKCWMKSLSR